MSQALIILILMTATDILGQTNLNRHDRLSKDEFVELKKSRSQFVPINIKTDTVVIVKYAPAHLEYLQKIARNSEFASNGEDTTGYTDEKLFGAKQVERGRQVLKKVSKDFPIDRAKELRKNGVMSIIVDEATLRSDKQYADKYWLTTVYVCNQEGLKGPWMTTITSRIYDPRTGKFYETFLPTNYDLLDLVD